MLMTGKNTEKEGGGGQVVLHRGDTNLLGGEERAALDGEGGGR